MSGAGTPPSERGIEGAADVEVAVEEVFDGFEEDSPEEIIAMADAGDDHAEPADAEFDAAAAEQFVTDEPVVTPEGETVPPESDGGPTELADRDAETLFGR